MSVRRPWRRRGLASALILSACVALRERGMTEAALGVDSESLSGALGMYERLGFAQSHAIDHLAAHPAPRVGAG